MKRILLDENIPLGLVHGLPGQDVRHVRDERWRGLSNGDLLAAAEAAGFDLMITADRNLRHQQNLAGRRLAILVLGSNNWTRIRRHLPQIEAAIGGCAAGSIRELPIGRDA